MRAGVSRRVVALASIIIILVITSSAVTLLNYSARSSVNGSASTSSNPSSSGIELVGSINATTMTEGDRLNISITLFNSSPGTDNVSTSDDSWNVQGFPVAMWAPCTLILPIEFTVVKGNYSLGELQAMNENYTNATPYACADSYTVQNIVFQPDSDEVNLTGVVGVNGELSHRQLGTYSLDTNFTVSGYWWYPVTSADSGDLNTPVPGGFTFQYPEVSPTDSTPFVPGVYTLIVGDEWGQVYLTHFTVES
jgi:hypothetical protein